jgi:hypothetical protein
MVSFTFIEKGLDAFDGKKWEAMGCESGNNLILCGLSKKFKQK